MKQRTKWREQWDRWDQATDKIVWERDCSCVPCYAEGRVTVAAIHHILGRGQSKEQTAAKCKVMVCNSHHPPKHEMPGTAWPYVHPLNRLLLAMLRKHHGYSYVNWDAPIDEDWGIPNSPVPPEPPEPEEDDEPPWPSE